MLRLDNEMFLYHGSYCEVAVPNLSKCAAYKDFGKGFYLTTSKKQAEKYFPVKYFSACSLSTLQRSA